MTTIAVGPSDSNPPGPDPTPGPTGFGWAREARLLPSADAPFTVGPDQAHLRLLATTDLHVHVFPYDYYADRPSEAVGLARVAGLMHHLRSGARNAMLFDNGDFLQGSPLGDFVANERGLAPGEVHPMLAAMNRLGYDAGTLGNHEFDHGIDFLQNALAGASFPVVCANIWFRAQGETPRRPFVLPSVILSRMLTDGSGRLRPVRVGVLGLAPPQIEAWNRVQVAGRVETSDIVATAAGMVTMMIAAGAEVIVALAHTGIGETDHAAGMENAALPLARVPGVDALVLGHVHKVFPSPHFAGVQGVDLGAGTICGVPATMPGLWGSHLGVIDLLLGHDGQRWRVCSGVGRVHPISRRRPGTSPEPLVDSAPEILAVAEPAHRATLAYVRRRVGTATEPLNTYFALVSASAAVAVVAAAQREFVAAALRGTAHDGITVLSAAAPFKAGGLGGAEFYTDVAIGRVAIKNVADLYIYPNLVRALRLTGRQIADWLERSAGMYNRIAPGEPDQPLIDPDFASYNFDMIAGLSYRIDLSQPARFDLGGARTEPLAQRIVELCQAGRPLDPDAEFILATNDYRASGGGGFPGCDGTREVLSATRSNREIVVDHIMAQNGLARRAECNWSLAPLRGASVTFDTGPGARAHLGAASNLDLTEIGDRPGGFVRFRLRL